MLTRTTGANMRFAKMAGKVVLFLQRYNRPRLIKAIRISEARVKVYTSFKSNE